MRRAPKLIVEDWMPSTAMYRWAQQMHISVQDLHKHRHEFVLWHTEKNIKRSNFNLAFKNWLKKAMEIDASKIRPASFKDYVGEDIKVSSKETGRAALNKLRGRA